jgi:dTDP-4-dehydrorhamnose 3,5-epimerase
VKPKYTAPFLMEPTVHGDARGYFFEPYNIKTFAEKWGINENFVQDNESLSRRGVLRGLHYQIEPMAQAKLVRVVLGEVLDVAVDIRKSSPDFGKVYIYVLTAEKHEQLFVPPGFAHGFAVLSETAIFQYKVDNFYSKADERGIAFNDPELNIDWKLDAANVQVSEKDRCLPAFRDAEFFA